MVNKQKQKGTQWEHLFLELVERNIKDTKQAKRIAGSGALGTNLNEPFLKGDFVLEFSGFPRKFRGEAKVGYGGAHQLTVKRDWLNKIIEEAHSTYSYPIVACKFLGAKSSAGAQYFIIFDFDTFCDIINYVNETKRELDLLYEKIEENGGFNFMGSNKK